MQRNLDSYSLKTVANKVRNFKLAPSAKLSVKEQIQVLLSILRQQFANGAHALNYIFQTIYHQSDFEATESLAEFETEIKPIEEHRLSQHWKIHFTNSLSVNSAS